MTLPSHAQVVVIGGGIVGCSTAYHLARDHGAEVLLLEQNRLTSGSTWHAAGLVGQLRSSAGVTRLLKRSVELYAGLERETGLATGWAMTGCLRLATTRDRWVEQRRLATTARSFGMEMHLLSPSETEALWPLLDVSDLVGASWLPTDGQASPGDITMSLARGARMRGVRIEEETAVTGLEVSGGRVLAVLTDRGRVGCETVVACAGLWSREVAGWAGVSVPLVPVRHQYIVTQEVPGLARDAPTLRDPDRRTYFKEEVGGLVMGGYEPDPQVWDVDAGRGHAFRLFDDDWDHFGQHLEQAVARVPALAHVGVKRMINGAESFTPDGNFILGRAPGVANLYLGCGFNAFGIAAGGGAGWALAHWAVEGEAPVDLWAVDVRRFGGAQGDRAWVAARTAEAYGRHYAVAYPHEEMESGRPLLASPLYGRLLGLGAVMGSKMGWERANHFGGGQDAPSQGRPLWHGQVAGEHRAAREGCVVFDQTSFAKFEVEGAAEALDAACAGDVMRPVGRVTYTQMLNARGGIEADLTVARVGEARFYLVTGTGFRTHDGEWLRERLPRAVAVRDVTEERGVLAVMGPRSREVLSRLAEGDLGAPFGSARGMRVAGREVLALRITYVGELGWELHAPLDALPAIFEGLLAAGAAPAGYRAIESLRLEKQYRAWGADLTAFDTPLEAGLGWAVKMRSGRAFLGREALERQAAEGIGKRLVGLRLLSEAVLVGRETVLRDGGPVGYLTSGGWGHTVGAPLGMGYARGGELSDGALGASDWRVVVAGEEVAAQVALRPWVDPEGLRVRA